MRSFLFVPGDSVRKFESAKKTAADALILDLEDSIAPDQKVIARGVTRGELSWLLDSNERTKHMLTLVGGTVYKRYRIYEKPLS